MAPGIGTGTLRKCEGFKQGNSATYIDDDWADMCAEAIRARGTKEGV